MIKMNWKPNVGIGDFLLKHNITGYIDKYHLILYLDFGITGLCYKLSFPETYLYVENGVITGISSDETFVYKNVDFIGNTFARISNILNSEYEIGTLVEYDDNTKQIPIDFDDLGLQIWVDENFIIRYVSIYQFSP